MSHLRRRKNKVILHIVPFYILLGALLLISLYIFGTNMPQGLLLTLVGGFIAITLVPIFFCLGASLWWGLAFSRFWWV